MQDPFETLGVSAEANDEDIHRAYLAGIRRSPPEKDPQRFQALLAAYELIKTHKQRLQYALFDTTLHEPQTLFERLFTTELSSRPQHKHFANLLRASATKLTLPEIKQ